MTDFTETIFTALTLAQTNGLKFEGMVCGLKVDTELQQPSWGSGCTYLVDMTVLDS